MSSTLITQKFWLNKEVVEIQLDLLDSFAKSLAYYRAIHQDYKRIVACKEYWCHTMNTCYLRALNDWCIVFGPNSNESHWKKVSTEHAREVSDEVRKVILCAGEFHEQEWTEYWQNLTEFRHKYVAHRIPDYREHVPHLTKAFDISVAYFEWLKVQLRPCQNEPKALNVLYSEYQIEIIVVLKNYVDRI